MLRIVAGAWLAALVGVLSAADVARAQHIVGPREASRAQLETVLDSLQRELQSARDGDRRDRLREDVAALEHRLQHGDLYPRDVVVLSVEGQEAWSGEFSVTPQQEIELPRLDPISLDGVLYAELEPHLQEYFGQYLRDPRVRAQALKRVAILGEVGSPGFYNLPGSMLVSEAIMEAGGPSQRANVEKTELRSWGQRLARDRENLPAQGLSLDRLGVSSGDEIFVPEKKDFSLRNIAWGLGATATVIGLLSRIF